MALSAPVFAGSGADATLGATSVSWNTTVTAAAGDLLVAFLGVGPNAATLSSVSCGGLTWTVTDTILRGTACGMGIGYALAPSGLASGTGLTGTFSASTNAHFGLVYIVSGAASASVRDTGQTLNFTNTTTPTTTSFTTTNANDIIMVGRNCNDNIVDTDWTAGTGYTKCPSGTFKQTTARTMLCEYQIVSATGTYTASLTNPIINGVMAVTAFKESAVTAVVLPERNTPRTHP